MHSRQQDRTASHLRLIRLLSPVEIVALAALSWGLFFTHLAGRRFYWLARENLELFSMMLLWYVPCLAVRYAARLFSWRRRTARMLYLAYYVILSVFLMGSNLVTALVSLRAAGTSAVAVRLIGRVDLALAAVVVVCLLIAGKRDPRRAWQLTRAELSDLLWGLRLLISLAVVFSVYSNLKAIIPVLRPGLWDGLLYRLDRTLFLGRDPLALLASITSPHFRLLMIRSYYCLFFFLLFGLSGAFVFGTRHDFLKVLLGLQLTYLLGLVGYYLIPSVGPAFYNETWHLFTATSSEELKTGLYQLYCMMCEAPTTTPVDIFQGLAAFPSLHVAIMGLFLYHLWRLEKVLVWLLIIPTVLLTVSTIYLGWHYVVDIPAGLVVTVAAVFLADHLLREKPPA